MLIPRKTSELARELPKSCWKGLPRDASALFTTLAVFVFAVTRTAMLSAASSVSSFSVSIPKLATLSVRLAGDRLPEAGLIGRRAREELNRPGQTVTRHRHLRQRFLESITVTARACS